MARETKPHKLSSTVTEVEKIVLDELDEIITESRAEFVRRVVIREARKEIAKTKRSK